jgi:UDP-N-acetylmuramate dehydrogenase
MDIKNNFSLKTYNTFSIDVIAKYFISPQSIEELKLVIENDDFKRLKKLIIGGGSNILFKQDFEGLVIHPSIKVKSVINKNEESVLIKAGAGENWDEFVEWAVNNSFAGLENLSLIPGTVGACPIQNIGAYGVEVGELIEKVEAIELKTGIFREFSNLECNFGYRNSIFKKELKDQCIITAVYFRLNLKPEFKTHYGSIQDELKKYGELNLLNIRRAIIDIRQSKLPDPEIIPNAGSFFKNPVVPVKQAEQLKSKFPGIVCYKAEEGFEKIAAGWMIDYLDWKGKTHKGAGVHEKQALVLVNKQNATGEAIIELASLIKESVCQTFGLELEFEVNIY